MIEVGRWVEIMYLPTCPMYTMGVPKYHAARLYLVPPTRLGEESLEHINLQADD